jgi:hypothetical protein
MRTLQAFAGSAQLEIQVSIFFTQLRQVDATLRWKSSVLPQLEIANG